MYSDKPAKRLRFNAIFAYPAHVVWSNFTVKRRRSLNNSGYKFWGLLPVEAAEMEPEDLDGKADKSVSQYGLTLLKVVPLEKLNTNTSSTSSPKE